jgi:hypothetical protein
LAEQKSESVKASQRRADKGFTTIPEIRLCLLWPPLDRAHLRIALKNLLQCGDQDEREKRLLFHLEKLTNHSIPAARWRRKSAVLVVRELAFEF